jgi:hypothetical protein
MCNHPTTNILVQIVITGAMKDYFITTGKNCSSKYRILQVIIDDLPNYHDLELLNLCHRWRFNNSTITNEDIVKMNYLYEEWKKYRKRNSRKI